jgi:hypothetical protein
MQIEHKKNTAYYLAFPMVDSASPASFKTGVSPVDTAYYKDGAGAWSALAITDTATEVASTGVYEIDLTAAELNHDQVIIKFAVAGAADSAFLLDMRTELAEDLGNGSGQVSLLTATQASIDAIETTTDFLPQVTAGAAGGLFIAGTNAATTITTALTTTFTGNLTGSVDSVTNAVGSVTGAVGSVTGAVGSVAGNVDGNVTGSVASVTAGVTLANGAITNASLAGNMEIVFETDFATNYNATRNAWVTNAQDFVGTAGSDPFNGQVVAASVTGAVGSVTGAVGSVTGNVDGNVTGSIGALTSAAITDVWATDTLTEAYAADGAAGTPAQLLYMLWSALSEFAISSTTITCKRLDGSTTAMTFTLDDGTSPTSRTRAT